MTELKLISAYQSDLRLRSRFNDLLQTVFHFDLDNWYKLGRSGDFYFPYSLWDGERILSSISVSKINMMAEGVPRRCLQVGTVMTHPDYRKRGFAARIMNHIFDEWESKVDMIYLFSNAERVNFYSMFGFEEVPETVFTYDPAELEDHEGPVRKLDFSDPGDFEIVERLAGSRMPGSRVLGAIDAKELFLFRALYFSRERLYYLPDPDLLVIFDIKDSLLELYDIVSPGPFDAAEVLGRIIEPGIKSIRFFFTPDQLSINCTAKPLLWDAAFFIKSETIQFSSDLTSQFSSEA